MLDRKKLYKNVDEGIQSAPEHLTYVYSTVDLRYVIEALLLDGSTAPMSLYVDLFGFLPEDITDYSRWFFNTDSVPMVSRVDFYKNFNGLPPDSYEYEVKKQVFYGGWEAIDITFNRGRNIDITSVVKETYARAVVFSLGQLQERLESPDFMALLRTGRSVAIKEIKDLLSISKDAGKLFPKAEEENAAPEQLEFEFASAVAEVNKTARLMHSTVEGVTADALGDIKPFDESASYLDIISDVKDVSKLVKEEGNEINKQCTIEEIDTGD